MIGRISELSRGEGKALAVHVTGAFQWDVAKPCRHVTGLALSNFALLNEIH
jgi:hypothetical protein